MTVTLQPPAALRPGLRAQWLHDERITFLNHGSFGAVPRRVFDEQTEWPRRRRQLRRLQILLCALGNASASDNGNFTRGGSPRRTIS